MTSNVSFQHSLQRFEPARHSRPLVQRSRADLSFWNEDAPVRGALLPDTTVYIDYLQNKLPAQLNVALRSNPPWHSSVTECEMSILTGLLDHANPGTPAIIAQVARSIEERNPHRILTPDREIWREAGILAGLLARLQQYGKADQRRALNDALLLCTAVRHGCTVLTRNWKDFDLLLQLDPRGRALFYDAIAA